MIYSTLNKIICRCGISIAALIPLLILAGCRPQGHFIGGRYFDSTGSFSVIMEGYGPNDVCERPAPHQNQSMVNFSSGIGTKTSIEFSILPGMIDPREGQEHPEKVSELLSGYFHDEVLVNMMKSWPKAKITNEEVIASEDGLPELFVVLQKPEGSIWYSHNQKRMLDDFEGCLLFFEGNQLVLIETNNPMPSDLSEKIEMLRTKVCKVRATYRNERWPMTHKKIYSLDFCDDFSQLQGRVVQDRYFDPMGNFSIVIPNSSDMQTLEIEERSSLEKHQSMALFTDTSRSTSKRVDVEVMPDAKHLDLFQEYPDAAGELLQNLFQQVTLPNYINFNPGTVLKFDEVINPQSSDAMFFSVVEIPGASKYIDIRTGKHLNGLLGTLMFFSGRQLVKLSHFMPLTLESIFSASVDHLRQGLLEMHGTCRNERDCPQKSDADCPEKDVDDNAG